MPKTRALIIFLICFSIVLAIYIVTQGVSIYKANKNITRTTATPSIDCAQYFFAVTDFSYDGYAISFEIKNEAYALETIHNVTVSGLNIKSAELKNLVPGAAKQTKINDVQIEKNFSVYVDGCAVYKKTCFLEENSCR